MKTFVIIWKYFCLISFVVLAFTFLLGNIALISGLFKGTVHLIWDLEGWWGILIIEMLFITGLRQYFKWFTEAKEWQLNLE